MGKVIKSKKKCRWYPFCIPTEKEEVASVSSFEICDNTWELLDRLVRSKEPVSITLNDSDRGRTNDDRM